MHLFCLYQPYDPWFSLSVLLQGFPKLFSFVHKGAIMMPKSCDILEKREAPNFYNFKRKWMVILLGCIVKKTFNYVRSIA